jgi:hypothetical protein
LTLGRVHTLIFCVHIEDAAGGDKASSNAFETFKEASNIFERSAEKEQRKQWRWNMEDEQESMPSVRGRKSGLGDKLYEDIGQHTSSPCTAPKTTSRTVILRNVILR